MKEALVGRLAEEADLVPYLEELEAKMLAREAGHYSLGSKLEWKLVSSG